MKKTIKMGLLTLAVGSVMGHAYASATAEVDVNASVTSATCDVTPVKRSVVIHPVSPAEVKDANIDVSGATTDIFLNVSCTNKATSAGYESLIVTGGMDGTQEYFTDATGQAKLGIKLTNQSAKAPTTLPTDAPAKAVVKSGTMTGTNNLALINSKLPIDGEMSLQAHFVAQLHTLMASTPAGYTTTVPIDFSFNYQ